MLPGRGPSGLLLFVALPLVLLGCGGGTGSGTPVHDTGQEGPVAEPGGPGESGQTGAAPSGDTGTAEAAITEPVIHPDGSVTYPHGETIKPLTEDEEALLAKDPEGLTKDERRQQAYLRRRKIMLDPDSAGAQHIVETITAIESGELEAPQPPPRPTTPTGDR